MLRARIVQAIRAFFIGEGILEVETPVLIPAPAPEAHIQAPRCSAGYLQTSPELAMKRLLAAGCPALFQVARCFREGERGRRHLPEFTMLEWYRPNADYTILMEDCRRLLTHLATTQGIPEKLTRGDISVDPSGEWETLTVGEAYLRHAGVDAESALESGDFDLIMVEKIEPQLGIPAPTILKDYPAGLGALARLKPDNPRVAERFELYVAGVELANGFSELTDPVEQRARFEIELERRRNAREQIYPEATKFLEELRDMPPSAGIAIGVDRLVMLFAGEDSVDGVVAFTPEEL